MTEGTFELSRHGSTLTARFKEVGAAEYALLGSYSDPGLAGAVQFDLTANAGPDYTSGVTATFNDFTVVGTDTTPPVLTLPANLTVLATSTAGAVVSFAATALDNIDGAVPVLYSIDPGSTFPIGTTTVTVSAIDGDDNIATGTFTVTIQVTPPTITGLTPWQNVFAANSATFNVSATGATGYQWERSTDGGANWTALSDGGSFAGTTTSSLTVTGVNTGMSGWLFRAVVSNAGGSNTTLASPLTVVATPTTPGLLWGPGSLVDGIGFRAAPVPVAGGVVSVRTGYSHTLYIKNDGTLWATGYNFYGQLGDGTTINRSTPVQVTSGVAKVTAGGNYTMFIKTDGTLWGMGANGSGGLGDGTTTDRNTPVQVASNVTSVTAAGQTTLFLKTDGTLWAMGANFSGQLGDGTMLYRNTPVQIASGVASVTNGENHTLFIKTDGTLWAMGKNAYGELGDGTTTNRSTPVQIATNVTAVATGFLTAGQCSLFLKGDGTLWAMGNNFYGQLGDGTTIDRSTPVQVAGNVARLSAGVTSNMFLKTDGTLWAMGNNDRGQLGDGTTINRSTPVQVATSVTTMDSRGGMFIKTDATLWVNRGTPVQRAASVATVVGGSGWNEFIQTDGTLWGFGGNNFGQLGDGTVIPERTLLASDVVAADIGNVSALYTKSDGTLWSIPGGQVPGVTNVAAVSVGDYDPVRLYLKTDGTLWRLNADNTSSPLATGVVAVAAGLSYVAYVKTDGTLWGQDLHVQDDGFIRFGDGTGPVQVASDVVSLAAAGWHLLFVKSDQTLWGMGTIWSGWGDAYAWDQFVSTPVQVESGVILAAANPGHNLFVKADGTLWTRAQGWTSSQGPSVLVDSNVVAAAAVGYLSSTYLKSDGTLWSRSGIVGTLGPPVQLADGGLAVSAGTDAGDMFIVRTGVGAAPVITQQPHAVTVNFGAAASLEVSATGAGLLDYQWFKDGVPLANGRSAQYTIGYVTGTDAGTYTVTVHNGGGSVTSQPATITVDMPPAITTQPVGFTAAVHASGTLMVAAAGTPAPTYQWRKTGTPIPGATSATLSFANLATSDAGSYDVVVTNAAGSVTSNTVSIAVNKLAQTITFTPPGSQIYPGGPVTLHATASSGLPVSFSLVSGPAMVSGDQTTFTGTGTVTIRATQAGDATYAAATAVDQSFTVSSPPPVVPVALVNHAPTLNGAIEGTVQMLLGESVTLNGGVSVTGNLLVPGTPTVKLNGSPTYGGTTDGTGGTTPSGYTITLNGSSSLGHVVRRTNPVAMPAVAAPPSPTGTRSVTLNSAGQSVGLWATLRNLTLNGNVGQIAVPVGTYGDFTANGGSGFTLGVAGATQPSVYYFQHLTLNGNSSFQVVGPVIVVVASGVNANSSMGVAAHPAWLTFKLSSGGLTLNGNVNYYGFVTAPAGTVTINGNSLLVGGSSSDRLIINGNGRLRLVAPSGP